MKNIDNVQIETNQWIDHIRKTHTQKYTNYIQTERSDSMRDKTMRDAGYRLRFDATDDDDNGQSRCSS